MNTSSNRRGDIYRSILTPAKQESEKNSTPQKALALLVIVISAVCFPRHTSRVTPFFFSMLLRSTLVRKALL